MPSSPASPGSTTNSASPEKIDSSALTTSTWMVLAMQTPVLRDPWLVMRGLQCLGLLDRLFDRPHHVERLLRQLVALAVDDHLEALDRLLERHELAFGAGKHFGHVKRLRQEALDQIGRASCRAR